MAILDEKTIDFISTNVDQTIRLGVRLGELLEVGDLVCLAGELGTGKTAMAQGIGRGWGAGRRVTSPSFTLVNEYPRLRDDRILYRRPGRYNCWPRGNHDRMARTHRGSSSDRSPLDRDTLSK